MGSEIQYKPNPRKIIEVLTWLAEQQSKISLTNAAGVLFYADKAHLAVYGRPVTGDRYIATEHGPVPELARDLVLRQPKLGAELLGQAAAAFQVMGDSIKAERRANTQYLSRTDISCLGDALGHYGELDPSDLTKLVQDERAWAATKTGEAIDYALFFEGEPDAESVIAEIREEAASLVF